MRKILLLIPLLFFTFSIYAASDLTSQRNPYYKVLKQYTRESEIYSTEDIHAQYIVNATYLSEEFRSSFKTFFKKFYPDGQDGLAEKRAQLWSEDQGEVSFLVALYAKNRKMIPLGDPNSLWDLSLKMNGETYKPQLVEKVITSPLELKFFPFVNRWFQLYRVSFPAASGSNSDKIQLNLSSVVGHSELKF